MGRTPKNKWFFIGICFFAVFILISAFIITNKVYENNEDQNIVTTSSIIVENFNYPFL